MSSRMMIDELAVIATRKLMIQQAELNARVSQIETRPRRQLVLFTWLSRRIGEFRCGRDVRALRTSCVKHDVTATVKPIREPAP